MKKLLNYKKSKLSTLHSQLSTSSGFTLVEMLAVAGILVILSVVVGGILVATLRGSNKTRITTAAAQNGNYMLSVLTNTLTNSKEFGYDNGAGRQTSCVTASPPSAVPISKIQVKNFDDTTTEIECKDLRDGLTITLNGESLINTSEVVVSSCAQAFTCRQTDEYSPPSVGLNLTLIQKNATSTFFEQQTEASFRTSISIRNYK